jgi:phage tail tape-measure protein
MKIKVLALTFTMLFFGGITATSFAQVLASTNTIAVVDNDDDKDKKKNKKKSTAKCDDTKAAVKSKDCDTKRSCCGDDKLKDDDCKDKKSGKDKK